MLKMLLVQNDEAMRNKLFQEALERAPEHSRVLVRKYTDIIDRVYVLMEEKGVSQKDLADRLGEEEAEIGQWLKGEHLLTLRSIARLEVALGAEIIAVSKGEETAGASPGTIELEV